MSISVLMPALSPTMEEGVLAKWHVKVGDAVRSGDVIAEIETDKATMEVEAVDEGVVAHILVEAGAEGVKVNAPIAVLAEDGEDPKSVPAEAAPPSNDEGSAPSAEPAEPTPSAAPSEPAADTKTAAPTPTTPALANIAGGQRIKASPLARRLAQQNALDLSALSGSGPNGRIIKRDIDAALAKGSAPKPAPQAPSAPSAAAHVPQPEAKTPEQMGLIPGTFDVVPLDGMRKTIARRMTESFRDVPHFPLSVDVTSDALLKFRKELNVKAPEGVKLSVNDLIIRATALALKAVPASNASYTPEGLLMHHHADVAVAVAIEGGLITPIVRRAETKGLAQISAEMKDLAARARARQLKPEEFQGGTVSLSNLGMFGIKSFASILNEPHGMILSVGAGEERPVVKDGALAVATVMSVTITCDHRVVDGAIGAQFASALKGFLEDPITMLF
ncbi:MAG: pyruvate dehydrogenase complex dihydrolipoamide acetyltransferase [Maricaulaceae bacterium]